MKELELRLRGLRLRQPSDGYCERVLAQRPGRAEATRLQGGGEPSAGEWALGTGDRIMRSRITKLAAAAVIIAAALIGLAYWLPTGGPAPSGGVTIEIPPELAEMPIEKLLDIHFGKTETLFDAHVVVAAVERALGKLNGLEVLALSGKYRSGRGRRADRAEKLAAYHPKPVTVVLEAAEMVVYGRVERVELDVNDLKAAIIEKNRRWIEDFAACIRAQVELEVLEFYPEVGAREGEILHLRPVFSTRRLDLLEAGKEYLIALKQDGDNVWMLPYGEGVYPVDANSGMVSGFRAGPMPIDEAWEFIMDCYDAIHEGTGPSEEVLDYWLGKLGSESLTDNWTAVEYFSTLPAAVEAGLVADAVERQVKMRLERTEENWQEFNQEVYQRSAFVEEAVNLVLDLGDAAACERVLAIYEADRSRADSIFNKGTVRARRSIDTSMLRALIALSADSGPEKVKAYMTRLDERRLDNILQSFIKTGGKDVEQILLFILEDPAGFGIRNTDILQLVWYGLAARGNEELRTYLEEFLADPENTDLGVEHYRNDANQTVANAQNALRRYKSAPSQILSREERMRKAIERYRQEPGSLGSAVQTIKKYLEPQDKEFIPFLSEIVTKHWEVPGLIATRIPDPCFVPALRAAIASKYHGDFVRALYACGEEGEAIEIAAAHLEDYLADPNRRVIGAGSDYYSMWLTIRLLGDSGDASLVELVEAGTYGDSFRGRYVTGLQGAAITAYAKLAGEHAAGRLRELYASNDYYVRIAAAVSLWYVGDETGYELLGHFVNHSERSIAGIEARWHVDMYGGKPFHEAIVYLRSPETEALFLERLRHGVGGSDKEAMEVVRSHELEVLPVLVEHLASRDRGTRTNAHEMLKSLTGQNFGFDPGRFVGQQDEAIERWRKYVEGHLAEQQMNSDELTTE